jgi:hypothetical protein
MGLRMVGFYQELAHGGPSGGSLRTVVRPAAAPNEDRIAAYLRNGTVFAPSFSATVDVLEPGQPRMAGLVLHTDGVYEWPSDLAHFVAKYHAELPADFVAHMASSDFQPRVVPQAELVEIADEQQREMAERQSQLGG